MKNKKYTLHLAGIQQAKQLHDMMMSVAHSMTDPSLYICNSLEDVQQHLRQGSFAVTANDETGTLAGCLLCYIPLEKQENLGTQAFPNEAIYLMDTVVVLPEHRGNRLQQRMIRFAEQQINKHCYLMATVAPENIPSLRSFQNMGYCILETKEKYGGYLRHVMYKEWIGK